MSKLSLANSLSFARLAGIVMPKKAKPPRNVKASAPAPHAKPGASQRVAPAAASRPVVATGPAPKAARRAARNDDPDAEMYGDTAVAKARQRERARCAAIFASPEADGRFDYARAVAFETSLTAERAIELLATLPRSDAGAASARRAARNPRIGPGGSVDVSRAAAVAASWDRAFQAAHAHAMPRGDAPASTP